MNLRMISTLLGKILLIELITLAPPTAISLYHQETEAVKAFLPVIMPKLGITEIKGICRTENIASVKVLERCGFVKEFEGKGEYQGSETEICKFVYTFK